MLMVALALWLLDVAAVVVIGGSCCWWQLLLVVVVAEVVFVRPWVPTASLWHKTEPVS